MTYNYIAIEGNIGVGKTTLSKILAEKTGSNLLLENFRNNFFLPLFYNDKKKYGLHVELSFLIDRIEDLESFTGNNKIISDYFFSKTLLFAKINLDKHAFKIFDRVYTKFEEKSRKPDLILYLKRDIEALLKNIEKRGRKNESKITDEYLTNIQRSYDKHFSNFTGYKILQLDVSDIDFNKRTDKVEGVLKLLNKSYKTGITEIKL